MFSYDMVSNDTGMLLFGIAVLGLMGFLLWKSMGSSAKLTEFVRDDVGRVVQIIER